MEIDNGAGIRIQESREKDITVGEKGMTESNIVRRKGVAERRGH